MKLIKAFSFMCFMLCGTSFGFKKLVTELDNIVVQAVSENPDKSVNVLVQGPWSECYGIVINTCSLFESQHGKKIKKIVVPRSNRSTYLLIVQK